MIIEYPSTADAEQDDPTIRKCIGFARRLGFGGIEVVNLFAWRATSPTNLWAAPADEIVGVDNDTCIRVATESVEDDGGDVMVAWGAGVYLQRNGLKRVADVETELELNGIEPQVLRRNLDGSPAHPLMLPYSCSPTPWWPE